MGRTSVQKLRPRPVVSVPNDIPAGIAGVSARERYDVNSLAVPRKAQEAIGAITSLLHKDGRKMTINVEYNQLDPLLRATTHPEGDTNDDSGWSPFPGWTAIYTRVSAAMTNAIIPACQSAAGLGSCAQARCELALLIQPNLAKRLFDKRRFGSKQLASRNIRSLCAHSLAVSLSDRYTVSERFSQLPWATALGSTVLLFPSNQG